MKLTEIDKKILSEFSHNYREPYSKIAKKCRLSRTQVEYCIKKYIDSKLIKGFVTIFDLNKLDYRQAIAILIKLKQTKDIDRFLKKIPKENLQSKGIVLTDYDIYLTLIFKDETEMREKISTIIHNNLVSDYKIIESFETELYPLKFLGISERDKIYLLKEKSKTEIKINKDDIEILKILKNDGRTRIIDIAKKTGMSGELIIYKLKKLKENAIILGNRTVFDLSKLRYFLTLALISIKNLTKENKEIIKEFTRNNPYISSFGFMLGKENCFMNIFHKDEDELRKTIKELKEKFKEEEINIKLILLEEEFGELNPLPFLDNN